MGGKKLKSKKIEKPKMTAPPMQSVLQMLGVEDLDEVTIQDMDNKYHTVSLRMPIAKEMKVIKPLLKLKDKMSTQGTELPPRAKGETEDQYYERVGLAMMNNVSGFLLGFITDELIEAGAAILERPVKEVGEKFESAALVQLVIPFFKRLLDGLMKPGTKLTDPETPAT